jgi:hypothetical protein
MKATHNRGKSLKGHKASGGRVRMKAPKRAKKWHGRG